MPEQDDKLIQEAILKLLGRSREEETLSLLKDGWKRIDSLSFFLSLEKITSFETLFNMLSQFLKLDFRTSDELMTLERCLEIATPQQCATLWQLYNKKDEDSWARAYVVIRLWAKLDNRPPRIIIGKKKYL